MEHKFLVKVEKVINGERVLQSHGFIAYPLVELIDKYFNLRDLAFPLLCPWMCGKETLMDKRLSTWKIDENGTLTTFFDGKKDLEVEGFELDLMIYDEDQAFRECHRPLIREGWLYGAEDIYIIGHYTVAEDFRWILLDQYTSKAYQLSREIAIKQPTHWFQSKLANLKTP